MSFILLSAPLSVGLLKNLLSSSSLFFYFSPSGSSLPSLFLFLFDDFIDFYALPAYDEPLPPEATFLDLDDFLAV